ncbi:TIGR03620 family F420-dependent LLM class oxidoreductase [Amycolatopsis rhabdoformis]|uniref:TIGR03620 family F420-dependent LLM class oxidoreductase n=1 Tax=Amycolatopsis rhabdoformis TaxID=1448059 RepID=A0ABZ1I9P9_9PSEU|nr:TIGR03620 family F420-dependent LLM class oxidoreductase [Amycolatopsis rhabdoformis]WSE31145.1 TIGR03620 family F420-dependent LLM class oxidoreductase [Amycolatopsis rhabdoformis]
MTDFGPVGAATPLFDPKDPAAAVALAVELEELGYPTLWLPGGQGDNLALVPAVVRATQRITVTNGILPVDHVRAADVASTYRALAATHPGRWLPGLGGAHGARPLATLSAYLDELEPTVPASACVLSALGPRMLELARDRASVAYPYLVTPAYVASARQLLGPDTTLAVLVSLVADASPARARATVRAGSLGFLSRVPGYAANFRRMGFTEADITGLSDRLVDAVTVHGSFDTVLARLREYLAAGADQVVVPVADLPKEWVAELPAALS